MATKIMKTTQSLTTAAEMRDATNVMMQPHAKWEEYLTPAPLSIAIMGELVFISSCDDFSISNKPPKNGFKYLQYPDSFRACLMQVCNSGWHAFNEAHKNMYRIHIQTGLVPDYMKEAVNILFNYNDHDIDILLSNQLESIRKIANQCETLAGNVEKKYIDVINLIDELLVACTGAKCFYGEELENVKRRLKENEIKKKSAEERNERFNKEMENMSKQVQEVQDAFNKSLDSLPSGMEIIRLNFVEGLANTFSGFLNGVASVVTDRLRTNSDSTSDPDQDINDEKADMFTKIKVCSMSGPILTLAVSLKKFINENEIDWKNLYDQKTQTTNTTWFESQFKMTFESLEKIPECKEGMKALLICNMGIAVCNELAKYTPDKKCDETTTKELINKITHLNEEALAFDSKSKGILGSPALSPTPPMMFKTESIRSGSQSAGQIELENARIRIEQTRAQLKQTRELYSKSVEEMNNNQKELDKILIEMQNCNFKEIDFTTTIKMLTKGLDAIGRVKDQWTKMVQFFQMVSSIVETSLSMKLKDFAKTSEDTQKLSYDGKLQAKDLLYNQAFQASNFASLVHMIAGTYTEVSNKYLMDRVSSLSKLMAMDTEKPEFLQERMKLQESCRAAQDGIQQLVLENKEEFDRKTNARMAKIERELKAILPSAPTKESERIKEIVQSGFDLKVNDYS